jgi:hypothetical protein
MKARIIAGAAGSVVVCSASREFANPGSKHHRASGEELDYNQAAGAAIDSMNQFYNEAQGRWSLEVAWWLSGFALQDILDYMHKTGSRKYMLQAKQVISLQKAPLPWWPQGGGLLPC